MNSLVQNVPSSYNLLKRAICTACCTLAVSYTAKVHADIEIQPKLDVTLLHIIDATLSENSYEGHEVGTLKPALTIQRKGLVWNGSLDAEHTYINQFQEGYDNTSFSNVSLNNQLAFWQNRLTLSNTLSRRNQNIDTSLGATADPIFGQSEFVDVDTITTQLILKNSVKSNWANSLSVSQSETKFDETQLEETDATVSSIREGKTQTVSLALGYGQVPSQIRGGMQLSASRTINENQGDRDYINASLYFGIPIVGDVDFVVNGSKNKNIIENSVLDNSDLESESYGAGLAWRFGNRSNIEVTYNNQTVGEDDSYLGYKLELYPNERSRVSYEQSQRFYGESHSFDLSHTAKRWSLNINYSEDLGTKTRIERSEISLGDFLCSVDSSSIDDCTFLDETPDTVDDGFFLIPFTAPVFSLEEESVLTRSALASLTYQMKKATLTYTHRQSETEYLERTGIRETISRTATYTHTMTRRNALSISATESDSTSAEGFADAGDRESYNINASFSRKMSRNATGKLSLVKYKTKSPTGNLNREDTRVELNYSYVF